MVAWFGIESSHGSKNPPDGKPVTMELHSGDYTVDQQNHYDLV